MRGDVRTVSALNESGDRGTFHSRKVLSAEWGEGIECPADCRNPLPDHPSSHFGSIVFPTKTADQEHCRFDTVILGRDMARERTRDVRHYKTNT